MSSSSSMVSEIMSSHYAQTFQKLADTLDVAIPRVEPVFLHSEYAVYNEVWGTRVLKQMPRFGYSKDLMSLSGGNDLRNGYVTGVLFSFLIILIPFLAWSILLVAFKGLSLYHEDLFGFLSGEPMKRTARSGGCQVVSIRIVFVVSCCFLPGFAYLIVAKGFRNLQSSTSTFNQSNNDIEDVIDYALNITDTLSTVIMQAELSTAQNEFFGLKDQEICPALKNPSNSIAGFDESYYGGEDTSQNTNEEADDMEAFLNGLLVWGRRRGRRESRRLQAPSLDYQHILQKTHNAFSVIEEIINFSKTSAQAKLASVREGLQSAKQHTQDVSNAIGKIQQTAWIFPLVPIPLVVIPLFMALAALSAHFNFTNDVCLCSLHYGFLPVLIVWIVLSYIFCSISAVLAVSNADFCSGSGDDYFATPDSSVLLALDRTIEYENDASLSSFTYQTVQYYVHQCVENKGLVDPFLFLRETDVRIDAAQEMIAKVIRITNRKDLEQLSLVCERDLVVPIFDLLGKVQDILRLLKESSTSTLDLLDCERIVPIYTNTIYDGICEDFINGISWIHISLIGISFSGMLMITLRSAYQLCNEKENLPLSQEKSSKIKSQTKSRHYFDRHLSLVKTIVYGKKRKQERHQNQPNSKETGIKNAKKTKSNDSNDNKGAIEETTETALCEPTRKKSHKNVDLEWGRLSGSHREDRSSSSWSSLSIVKSTYFNRSNSSLSSAGENGGENPMFATTMEGARLSMRDFTETTQSCSSLSLGSASSFEDYSASESEWDDWAKSDASSKKKKKSSKSIKKSSVSKKKGSSSCSKKKNSSTKSSVSKKKGSSSCSKKKDSSTKKNKEKESKEAENENGDGDGNHGKKKKKTNTVQKSSSERKEGSDKDKKKSKKRKSTVQKSSSARKETGDEDKKKTKKLESKNDGDDDTARKSGKRKTKSEKEGSGKEAKDATKAKKRKSKNRRETCCDDNRSRNDSTYTEKAKKRKSKKKE